MCNNWWVDFYAVRSTLNYKGVSKTESNMPMLMESVSTKSKREEDLVNPIYIQWGKQAYLLASA